MIKQSPYKRKYYRGNNVTIKSYFLTGTFLTNPQVALILKQKILVLMDDSQSGIIEIWIDVDSRVPAKILSNDKYIKANHE